MSDPTIMKLNKAVKDIVEQYPYNTFSLMLEAKGIQVPEQLGGNCLWQALKLNDKLRKLNIQTSLIEPINTLHVTSLAQNQENTYLFEPSLALGEVIKINNMAQNEKIDFEILPYITDKVGICVQKFGKNEVKVNFTDTKSDKVFSSYEYDLNSLKTIKDLNVKEYQSLIGEKIMLRYNIDDEVWYFYKNLKRGSLEFELINRKGKQTYTTNFDPNFLDYRLDIMSERIGISTRDIKDFFEQAYFIVRQGYNR